MGCAFWRQKFIREFNKFAEKNNLSKKSIPKTKTSKDLPNIRAIDLPGNGNYFGGARLQGARRAEEWGNYSLLQLNVNGKSKDLSKYVDDPARCITESSDMILEAYGKK